MDNVILPQNPRSSLLTGGLIAEEGKASTTRGLLLTVHHFVVQTFDPQSPGHPAMFSDPMV